MTPPAPEKQRYCTDRCPRCKLVSLSKGDDIYICLVDDVEVVPGGIDLTPGFGQVSYGENTICQHPHPPKDTDNEHYNGVCAFQDKCNDYSDFLESIEDKLNPDDEDPVCPIKCDFRSNPYPHTTSPDTQRIADLESGLKQIMGEIDNPHNFRSLKSIREIAIALLRESKP